jgi:hypothetical protein
MNQSASKLWALLEKMALLQIIKEDPTNLTDPTDQYIWCRANVIVIQNILMAVDFSSILGVKSSLVFTKSM